VGISIGLLALLFRSGLVDLAAIGQALRAAEPAPLLAAGVAYCVLGSVVRGYRWRALVRSLDHPLSIGRATELFVIGTTFNQVLVTGIGGDVVRTVLLAGDGLGRAHAASTVIVDRAIGILMVLVPGVVALVLVREQRPAVVGLLVVAGLVGLLGSLFLLGGRVWRRQAARLPWIGRLFEHHAIARFVDSFAEYGAGTLALATLWSLGWTVLLVSANALIGRSLGVTQATLLDWVIVVAVVALSTLLPSIGGWGVREWTYVGLLGALHPPVPPATATAISILFGGMNFLLAAVGALLILRERGVGPTSDVPMSD
jgi:hypothetical protein